MIRYVALLRGINVGGRKLIKMDQLRDVFESAGFKNVRTLIASGNVSFDAREMDVIKLTRKIEKTLLKAFGYEVQVVVRTIDDMRALVKRNPFKKIKGSEDAMLMVTFLLSTPTLRPKLPFTSPKGNLEVVAIHDAAVFVVARRKSNGWFDFPHEVVEKTFGARTTTRNWSTVQKLAATTKS